MCNALQPNLFYGVVMSSIDMSDLNCHEYTKKEWKKIYNKRYKQSERGKEANKRYQQTERGKEAQKRYRQTEKRKEANKRYQQTEKRKEAQKRYRQTEKRKEAQKRYRQTEEGKEAKKRYKQSERGKEVRKRYKQSERGKEANKRYKQSERGRALSGAQCIKRRAQKLNATVAWADENKILTIYLRAQRKTEQTGKQYNVDHLLPLQNINVCGLHCESNLRVILAKTNNVKYNSFTPEIEKRVVQLMTRDQLKLKQ